MAEVRAAIDRRLERPVAIKFLLPEAADQPVVRDRFEGEARLAARLSHPNVVAVFDSGEEDGVPYIVMERLSGETLRDRLAAGPMTEPEVRDLGLQILAAVSAAHAGGILHRDIKPANVLAAADGHWKVADFGIAKAMEVDSADGTATGLLLGTPAYLAPERLYGATATTASDLYSVGVVLYEALTGRRPFEPDATSPDHHMSGSIVPVATVRPGIDPALATAIDGSLVLEPSHRFTSASTMAAVLSGAADPWSTHHPETPWSAAGPAAALAGGAAVLGSSALAGATTAEPAPVASDATSAVAADAVGGPAAEATAVLGPSGGPPTAVLDPGSPASARRPALAGSLAAAFAGVRSGERRRPVLAGAAAALVALVLILVAATAGSGHSGASTTHKPPVTTVAPTTVTTATTVAPTTVAPSPPPPAPAPAPTHGHGHGGGGGGKDGGDGGDG
jgi:hypothetical protein